MGDAILVLVLLVLILSVVDVALNDFRHHFTGWAVLIVAALLFLLQVGLFK